MKPNTKICENCSKEFEAKRKDTKFCCSTCRSSYWKNNKSIAGNEPTVQIELRNTIIPGKEKESTVVKVKKNQTRENPEYTILLQKINAVKWELDNLGFERSKLISRAKQLNDYYDRRINELRGNGVRRDARGANLVYDFISDFATVYLLGTFLKSSEAIKIKTELADIKSKIQRINVSETSYTEEQRRLNSKLIFTESTINVEIEVEENVSEEAEVKNIITGTKPDIPSKTNVLKRITSPAETDINVPKTDKIICSTQLMSIDHKALNFSGKWKQFFGQPATNFHLAIHGMSGEGKSTFAIQFAHYLAEDFGQAIYISSEEGFSKTLKDKFLNNYAESEHLYLADLKSYKDIISEIKPNTFFFIFLDSLDDMRVGAQELKEIRRIYSNSAIITISQSTKDGKMRGSYEIIHDSDIAVSVAKGVAETTKNRFLKKGQIYRIFDETEETGFLPKNTVRV